MLKMPEVTPQNEKRKTEKRRQGGGPRAKGVLENRNESIYSNSHKKYDRTNFLELQEDYYIYI